MTIFQSAWSEYSRDNRCRRRPEPTLPPLPFEHDAFRAVALPYPFSVRRVQ